MEAREYYGYKFFANGTVLSPKGRVKSINLKNGRLEVYVDVNGKRKCLLLHRIMYKLFVNDFDITNKDLCVVCKDRDFSNISLDNLELKHRKDLIQGEKHRVSKISDEMAEQIKKEYNGKSSSNQHKKVGFSYSDLAKKYNVNKGTIASIVKGRSRNANKYKL